MQPGRVGTHPRPPPLQDDLITPTRNLTERSAQEKPKQFLEDLTTLKLRPRRGHDLRRTFIALAQVDGARRDHLETITHGPRGDIISVYTTFPLACPVRRGREAQNLPSPRRASRR
jgi:hypothetical protein